MLTQGFHEDAPVADVAAVLDDAGILALAASITRAKASRLVQEFGSLGAVVAAPVSRLIASGLTSRMADRVKVISSAVQRVLLGEIKGRDQFSNYQAVLDYLRASMAFESVEQFRVLYLDKRNCLICDEVLGVGTVDHTPVYPREVAKRCLEVNACAIILSHNHPSGDTTPSHADIVMTKTLAETLKVFGIPVHDHIIVARDGHTSFKAAKLI